MVQVVGSVADEQKAGVSLRPSVSRLAGLSLMLAAIITRAVRGGPEPDGLFLALFAAWVLSVLVDRWLQSRFPLDASAA